MSSRKQQSLQMLLNGAFDLVAMDLNLAELGDGMA
jgi:CheY-like chemotaxis protein